MPCTQTVPAVQGCRIQKMNMVYSLLSHSSTKQCQRLTLETSPSLCPGVFLGGSGASLHSGPHKHLHTMRKMTSRSRPCPKVSLCWCYHLCLPHPQKYSLSPLDIVWPLKFRIRRYFLVFSAFGVKMFRGGKLSMSDSCSFSFLRWGPILPCERPKAVSYNTIIFHNPGIGEDLTSEQAKLLSCRGRSQNEDCQKSLWIIPLQIKLRQILY